MTDLQPIFQWLNITTVRSSASCKLTAIRIPCAIWSKWTQLDCLSSDWPIVYRAIVHHRAKVMCSIMVKVLCDSEILRLLGEVANLDNMLVLPNTKPLSDEQRANAYPWCATLVGVTKQVLTPGFEACGCPGDTQRMEQGNGRHAGACARRH